MASKAEVVVFNHDFEERSSQDGSPSAANPELATALASGHDDRNGLPPIPSVNAEVAVEGKDATSRLKLAHSNQACICEGHGDTCKLVHEAAHGVDLRWQPKLQLQDVVGKKPEHRVLTVAYAREQKASLGHDGLAGEDGRLDGVEYLTNPSVVVIGAVEQSNEGPGVDENPAHRP
jgi:hypothetical protein